jgi:hypothetical protein
MTAERAGEIGNMTDDEVAGEMCDIKEMLEGLGLDQVKDPFYFFGKGFAVIR